MARVDIRKKLDSEIAWLRQLFQPIRERYDNYDYLNVLNVLIQLRKTIESLDEICDKQEYAKLALRCNKTEGAIEKLEDVFITTEGKFKTQRAWMQIITSYQHVLDGCNVISKLLADIELEKEGQEKLNKDSKIFETFRDRTRRLIESRFAERRKILPDKVLQILRTFENKGMMRSSHTAQAVCDACEEELRKRTDIAWDCIQKVHEELGSPIKETLATEIKKEMCYHIDKTMKEASELMAKRLHFIKPNKHLIDLEDIKNEVNKKIDVEVDLYVDSLLQKQEREEHKDMPPSKETGIQHVLKKSIFNDLLTEVFSPKPIIEKMLSLMTATCELETKLKECWQNKSISDARMICMVYRQSMRRPVKDLADSLKLSGLDNSKIAANLIEEDFRMIWEVPLDVDMDLADLLNLQNLVIDFKLNLNKLENLYDQKSITGKKRVKSKKDKTKKPERKYKPWNNPGDACFIIVHNKVGDWTKGIHFYHSDKHKNLRLRSGSRAENLLTGLKGKFLTPEQIKADIGKGKTKASDVVTYANKLLNEKIRGLDFTGLPKNYDVAFVVLNVGRYESAIPIYIKDEFDQKEIEQVNG